MIGKRLSRVGAAPFLFFLAVAILVVVVAVPVLLIFWNAFWVDGHFNVRDVVKILSESDTYRALGNSLVLAAGVTVTGTILGTAFAWLVTRTDLPMKGLMKVLLLVPFMLPSFIGALAWKMLLSPRSGYINRFFMEGLGFGDAELAAWVARISAAPWAEAFVYFKHEDGARGPRFARRLLELAGAPAGDAPPAPGPP